MTENKYPYDYKCPCKCMDEEFDDLCKCPYYCVCRMVSDSCRIQKYNLDPSLEKQSYWFYIELSENNKTVKKVFKSIDEARDFGTTFFREDEDFEIIAEEVYPENIGGEIKEIRGGFRH